MNRTSRRVRQRLLAFLKRPAVFQVALFVLLAGNIELLSQRLLYAQKLESPDAVWRVDPIRGRRLVENYSAANCLNTNGLRGLEPVTAPRPGETRIVCFGSSVTYGWRVKEPETYPRFLQERLAGAGADVHVYNAGCPGFTTCEMTALLVEIEPLYHPQIVVLVCGSNDLPQEAGGTGLQPYRELQPKAAQSIFEQGGYVDRTRSLLYRSATYRYLTYLIKGWKPHPTDGMDLVKGGDATETSHLTMSVDNLKIFAEFARLKGLKMLLVDEAWRQSAPRRAYLEHLRAAHAALAQRLGFAYLDLEAAFLSSGQPEELARIIATRLETLGWLSPVARSSSPRSTR
ncbi:MAG: SGNH/GDSL hydrolase family protein [Proteobacteria bacterium]|nr:SGNH/GDSL hydrolase family protein [Pseudomonadota bacterium]